MQTRRVDPLKKALFLRPDDLDRSVALLLLAARALEAAAVAGLPAGLAAVDRLVLLMLESGAGRTAADLQALLGLPKQTMSRHLQLLSDMGLIQREGAPHDRRRKLVQLTAAGRELAERLDRSQRRRLAAVFKDHGPEAVAGFEAVLLDLVAPTARPFLETGEER